mmetsp:Transcript_1350/g.3665  ORF Transcript_1350/g.3665 Transcript_1350/m.3665 type:complete len:148 (-) Transcript_1350:335-778(-)|eukprot:349632-Chlamydomonas_euryale.AAC.15
MARKKADSAAGAGAKAAVAEADEHALTGTASPTQRTPRRRDATATATTTASSGERFSSCATWRDAGPRAPPPLETEERLLMSKVRAIMAEERRAPAVKKHLFHMGFLSGAVLFDWWETATVVMVYVLGTALLCYGVYRQVMHLLHMD